MRVPDGAPVIGNSGQPGLWLNLAHGAFGWGLAFGAAQLLARQLAGQPLPFDAAAFAAQRLR
jgi:D-amino-acid dehydrogenase